MTVGEARISSDFQKLEEQIERLQNPQTDTKLQTILNYTVHAQAKLQTKLNYAIQAQAKLQTKLNYAIQAQAKLQTKLNYAIQALRFVVQSREALEVVSRPTIHQTRLDSVIRELEKQIERVRNPQSKTKLQRKLNYAAQEARGGTDADWSQLQMVQEELAILLMNSVTQ